jgi:hypothetical protein
LPPQPHLCKGCFQEAATAAVTGGATLGKSVGRVQFLSQ